MNEHLGAIDAKNIGSRGTRSERQAGGRCCWESKRKGNLDLIGVAPEAARLSNVLVTQADGKPGVKVIDFGVAKALNQLLTEKTLFTAFGQLVGTPQYMSPEQAELTYLDIDTRSDVYSLGVLCYEILTGSTLLDGTHLRSVGYAEMQRLICEHEPPIPSTRLSTASELLTAIAKHRNATPHLLRAYGVRLCFRFSCCLDWYADVPRRFAKTENRV